MFFQGACVSYAIKKILCCKIIQDMYSTIKARLLQEIDGKVAVSFTTDIWSRKAGEDSFVSCTAHYIKPEGLLERSVFSKCAHFYCYHHL